MGWIAVLIGSVCIKLFNLMIIDPILSILIAFYILYHVYKYIKEIFDIFMEKVPKNIDINKIKTTINEKFANVNNIHHIHIWTLDGVNNYMTAHILLKEDISREDIIRLKNDIKKELYKFNINHITLEIEYLNEKCTNKKC